MRTETGTAEIKSNASNGVRTVCRADGNQEDVSSPYFLVLLVSLNIKTQSSDILWNYICCCFFGVTELNAHKIFGYFSG